VMDISDILVLGYTTSLGKQANNQHNALIWLKAHLMQSR
jgi:hypothetical protein